MEMRKTFNFTSALSIHGKPEPPEVRLLKYHIDMTIYIMTVPIPPILAIYGIIGNCLSFLLMSQKKYDKSTTCFYMRCMAVSDCLFIYGRMFLRYLLVIAPQLFENKDVKPTFCRYYFVSLVSGLILSPWILVAMAFDRFIALTWPLRAAVHCTMRKAKITASVVFTLGIGFSLVQINAKWQEKYSFWLCPYNFDEPMDVIYSVVEGTMTSMLPIILFSILNVGILVAIYRSKRNPALNKSNYTSSK
jgi:hypothetical protein